MSGNCSPILLSALLIVLNGVSDFRSNAVFGGEKIQISEPSTNKIAPLPNPRQGLKPIEIGGGRPASEEVHAPISAPPSAQPGLNSKMSEFIDKQRNWIFVKPGSESEESTLKRIYGVRDVDFGTGDKTSRSVVQTYFEGSASDAGRTSSPKHNRDGLGADQLDGSYLDSGAQSYPSLSTSVGFTGLPSIIVSGDPGSRIGGIGSINPNGNLNSNPFASAPFGSGIQTPNLAGSRSSAGFGLGASPLDRVLDSRMSPVNRGGDPMNLRSDKTREELNPIIPRITSLTEPPGALNPAQFGGSIPSTRLDALTGLSEAGGARALGRSSLSPGFTPPTSRNLVTPKPAVLEIPRRKF